MKLWDYISDYRIGIFNKYWWKDVWYKQISSRIRPRNRWLTKKIPRTWADKDTILEICVIEALKHYVDKDGEDCFGTIQTDHETCRDFYKEVKYHYDLATIILTDLQAELDREWDKVPPTNWRDMNKPTDYQKVYGKIDDLEKEIYDTQTEIMMWVVENRNRLWT